MSAALKPRTNMCATLLASLQFADKKIAYTDSKSLPLGQHPSMCDQNTTYLS